jgi:hypothetical protein
MLSHLKENPHYMTRYPRPRPNATTAKSAMPYLCLSESELPALAGATEADVPAEPVELVFGFVVMEGTVVAVENEVVLLIRVPPPSPPRPPASAPVAVGVAMTLADEVVPVAEPVAEPVADVLVALPLKVADSEVLVGEAEGVEAVEGVGVEEVEAVEGAGAVDAGTLNVLDGTGALMVLEVPVDPPGAPEPPPRTQLPLVLMLCQSPVSSP